MLNGSILDIYPDNKKNVMVTWLVNNGKTVKIEDKYNPGFYVYASKDDLYTLVGCLRDLPQIKTLNFTSKKLALGSEKKSMFLKLFQKKLAILENSLKQLIHGVDFTDISSLM
jgi:hypothetical protein